MYCRYCGCLLRSTDFENTRVKAQLCSTCWQQEVNEDSYHTRCDPSFREEAIYHTYKLEYDGLQGNDDLP